MWLLLEDPATCTPADAAYRAALFHICPELAQAAGLAHAFVRLVRARQVQDLDAWIGAAAASGLREIRRFALGLRKDAAVRAALEQPWSQGQTEGQVTRLKLLKRHMVRRVTHDDIAPARSLDEEEHPGVIGITLRRKATGKAAVPKHADARETVHVGLR